MDEDERGRAARGVWVRRCQSGPCRRSGGPGGAPLRPVRRWDAEAELPETDWYCDEHHAVATELQSAANLLQLLAGTSA